jgi:hypothetical protein
MSSCPQHASVHTGAALSIGHTGRGTSRPGGPPGQAPPRAPHLGEQALDNDVENDTDLLPVICALPENCARSGNRRHNQPEIAAGRSRARIDVVDRIAPPPAKRGGSRTNIAEPHVRTSGVRAREWMPRSEKINLENVALGRRALE